MTPLQEIRLLIADNTPGLYIISDDEINYLLDRNYSNINRTTLDAARIILFNLAQRSDTTVDILSIRGSQAAKSYKEALQLYIKDHNLNGLLNNLTPYVGGISKSDMALNKASPDNNYVKPPLSFSPDKSYEELVDSLNRDY